MKFFIFLLLHYVTSIEIHETLPSELGSSSSSGNGLIIFNYILLYPSMVFYLVAIFAAICCCKPDHLNDYKDTLFLQIIAGIILLIASFLGYAATSKLTVNNTNRNHETSYLSEMQYLIQKNAENMDILYENIIQKDQFSNIKIKSLNDITFHYNSTFSDSNSKYRIAFNNIYYKQDTSNYLKFNLKEMDESRNSILSQIYLFCNKYTQFSMSIQNTLKSIKNDYFKSTKNVSILIENELNKLSKDLGEPVIVGDMFIGTFSYLEATGILLLVIVYTIVFFYANACTRCCFCIYPIFALIISCCTFGTCYYFDQSDYKNLVRCSRYSPHNNNKDEIQKIIKDSIINFNIDDELKNSFNDTDQIEIEKLYQKINSESIHVNYHKIFEQYASDKDYRNDLIQMIKIIQKEDNSLLIMKKIINEVSECSYSFYPDFLKMHNETENMFEFTIKDIDVVDYLRSSSCQDFVNGANCAIAGTFFLFIGLAVMTISVCCRRVDMGYFERIENSSPTTHFEFHSISASTALLFPSEASKDSFCRYYNEPKSKCVEDYIKGVVTYEKEIYFFKSFFKKYVKAIEGYGYCFYKNDKNAYKDLCNNMRTNFDNECIAYLHVFLDKRKVTELEDPENSLKVFVETDPKNIEISGVYPS